MSAILETTLTDSWGRPGLQLEASFNLPLVAGATPIPDMTDAVISTASTGGTLTGNQTLYYAFTAVTGGIRSFIGKKLSITIPAGTNTNTVTVNGIDFGGSAQMEVFRGTDPLVLRRLTGHPISVAQPFTDTGFATEAQAPPDPAVAFFRAKWRQDGDATWMFGAQNTLANGSPLKFIVPWNVAGQAIDVLLVGVSNSGRETPEVSGTLIDYTVIGSFPSSLILQTTIPALGRLRLEDGTEIIDKNGLVVLNWPRALGLAGWGNE